jgi:type VI secretion system protein VasI
MGAIFYVKGPDRLEFLMHVIVKSIALCMVVVFSEQAAAQEVEDCVGIADPNDRLNCFDQAFVAVESRPATLTNAWQVRSETSALDDSTSVFLSVLSDEPVRGRFGRDGQPQLTVRCRENTTSVIVTFSGLFMSDIQGRGRVDFRVDDNPSGNVNMTVSTNNEALGLWRGGQSIPFIENHLLDANSLYLRATPHSESAVEMRFNISGLGDVIGPLREACNW